MNAILLAGDCEVRPDERRLLVQGKAVVLGARAFDLLLVLIEHRERVVGKEELLERVWPGVEVEENNLTVQVSALRKILGPEAISTVTGRGYRFTLPFAQGSQPKEPSAPAQAFDAPTIAVLPFDNLSTDADMQFFSDGVSEEIIQRLSRILGVRIIGRTSSFQFRGKDKAAAVERLRCTHLLDGSLQRSADRVRVRAQLMEAASGRTLWSDGYDRGLADIFAVQDDIARHIARALERTFSGVAAPRLEPASYDLYLRSSPKSYAPDEVRTSLGLLEVVTERAPEFADAWGRVAYLRGFLHPYLPFADRAVHAARVEREAALALSLDPDNIDALAARCFVVPPYGSFVEAARRLDALRFAPGSGDGRRYIGWFMRHLGRVREALEETELAFRLDALDPMSINLLALARMAAGQVTQAIPLYEDLVLRVPQMSFPIASLLRAHAFSGDWDAVDRLLAVAATRPLREFQDTLPFVRAKRSRAHLDAWRGAFDAHITKTGRVDAARLVYAAHLGFVDDAYRAAELVHLGPAGGVEDLMGPDGYRTAIFFQANMPELRNDPRFARLCVRLGLVDFWLATGTWPDCVTDTPYDFRLECERAQATERESFEF
ncbi:MAG TPA: winged helix-turn-helix domain-containing protein [Polyangiaceae bacterium]|nr:winged helix-turn-helix domain-containing protein [Polyangiaceae bacterium]